MVEFFGRDGSQVLFGSDNLAVIVDEERRTVESLSELSTVAGSRWDSEGDAPDSVLQELANAALTELDIKVLSSSDRMYTIPKGVIAEAKRGLKWRKEEGRGGTKVGMNTARTLAKGGQIGIRKVRHIAKYFPRHEVDKKAKGYDPGEDGYPSNGRIAWALWGGDAGQRWASAIVEREDKKKSSASLIASSYAEDSEQRIDFASFAAHKTSEFYIRIRLDRGGIDRLYRVEEDGSCRVWDDGYWDDMGNVEHDFGTYDKALDDPYDKSKKVYVPVDRETAIKVSAMFDNEPFKSVFLQEIEFEETDMFEQAMPEMDWQMLDTLSADTPDELEEEEEFDDGLMASGTATFAEEGDGEYTSEERSEKASQQVRDKLGRFAETGSTVVIGGDYNYQGTITAQNPDAGTVTVELDNGNSVEVPGNTTQEVSTFEPINYVPPSTLDFTGILGEPRTPIDQAGASLPGRLPALNRDNLATAVNDWGNWVADQRLEPEYEPTPAEPFVPKEPPSYETAMGRYYQGAFGADGKPKDEWNPAIAPNVANEPLLRDWLDRVYGGASGSYQGGWYKPSVPVESKKSRDEVMGKENKQAWDEKYSVYASGVVAAGGDKPKELTPETSDVAPMYMAIVANDDPQAVMELVSLVPANTKSVTPVAFKRQPGKWVRDDKILADLNSPTPPPVVVLDNENLSAVVEQIDGDRAVAASAFHAQTNNSVLRALMAAGGADRNRGNAERLRRYWTIGKGGLKIRWNTPGDWTRCNRQLKKYMGPRAKGYCALRHKEMTGVWPGDKRNIGKKNTSIMASGVKSSDQIIEEFTLRARAHSAKSRMIGREGPKPTEHGSRFVIPLVIPEETETGDGRIFQKDSISMRDLPLPLLWQIKTGQGHDGSVVVGQIVHMERIDGGIGNAYGFFDSGSFGQEAERLVRHGFIRGVSADMDKFEADEPEMPEIEAADDESDETSKDKSDKINITSARVMAVTIVPKPAFQECYIQVVDESNDVEEETMQPDGVYVDGVNPLDASALVACGMVADAVPTNPPKEWFEKPKLNKATPLTITDDGQVFGHIAAWHVDHIGMAGGTRPPRSRSNYAYFHTGVIRTDSGDDVPVGQLTLAGGHAGLEASAEEALRHYDDTASAFADVHAGEDAYGIWVAGSLRPGTTPEQIRAARASAPSGDWRPIKGRLELVAVCQVNVPGFPIARARVASGQVMALVAAGANSLAQLKYDPLADLNAKVAELEAAQYAPKADEAKGRFAAMRQEVFAQRTTELASKVKKVKDEIDEDDDAYMIQMLDDDPENETAVISRRVRERLAREGKALPDGSFPIRNANDLRSAVRAYGRAKTGAKAATRKHIIKRAKQLKREDLIPPRWSTAYTAEGEELSLNERLVAAIESVDFRDYSEETRMEYAKKGIALPDGSFPIENVEDLKRAIKAHGRAKDIEKAKRHIKKRARALDAADLIPDEWKSASSVEDLRSRAELAVESLNSEALFSEDKKATFEVDPEDLEGLDDDEIEALKREARRMESDDDADRAKYTPETQPRDAEGKFRKVLARLKSDLGASGLQRVVEKVEEAENLDSAGDYESAVGAAEELIGLIDRLDAKALNPEALENVRNTAGQLGEVIANLPFAFGEQAEKIRFSDIPPALRDLIEDMIDRVEDKIGQEDADIATESLRNFMSGGDYYNQSEISSEMSKLLRLLT